MNPRVELRMCERERLSHNEMVCDRCGSLWKETELGAEWRPSKCWETFFTPGDGEIK